MRSLCILLELNGIQFKQNEINIFGQDEGQKNTIKVLQNAPSIKDGDSNIMADAPTLLKYLCRTKKTGTNGNDK